MDDLERGLQSLTDLSPPTSAELGADVLRQRATRVRRRARLAIVMPAAALVAIVLVGVVAFQSRRTVDVQAGDQVTTGTLPGLTARELELLDFVDAETRLRHQLHREMLWTATYTATAGVKGKDGLAAQRTATDEALAAYEAKRDQVQPARESQPVADASAQADNRLRSLRTIRKSVDSVQTDASRAIDDYFWTATDLGRTERALLMTTDSPSFFRGLLAKSDLAGVTDHETHTAALLIIPAEIGFYAAVLPTGNQPVPERNNPLGEGCGQDAQAGGDTCKLYRDMIASNAYVSEADRRFGEFATGEQKQEKRRAEGADMRYDELKRHAIEDGQGHNDLTGAAQGTTPVNADDLRAASIERVNRLIEAEVVLLAIARAPKPAPSTSGGSPVPERPPFEGTTSTIRTKR